MGESEAVTLGDYDMGVVQEPVEVAVAWVLGMISSNPDGCSLARAGLRPALACSIDQAVEALGGVRADW